MLVDQDAAHRRSTPRASTARQRSTIGERPTAHRVARSPADLTTLPTSCSSRLRELESSEKQAHAKVARVLRLVLRCPPMLALAPAALAGFLIGLRHATDADHVAAVSAIVARERTVRGAALVGAAWGLGHTLTLLTLGGAIVVFGLSVPPRVGLALELCVGLMLIGLGAWNLATRAQRPAIAALADHAALPHTTALESHHGAPPARVGLASSARIGLASPARRALRPLVVGSMHGLAGSAAAALLVVATARGTSWGLAYLLVFGIGTMLGMTVLTTALALPLRRALAGSSRAETWVRVGSGMLSFAIGAFVVYQVGFHDGLFLQ